VTEEPLQSSDSKAWEPITGHAQELTNRKLREETCKFWGYKIGSRYGHPVQFLDIRKNGQIVAQKWRGPGKTFGRRATAPCAGLRFAARRR